MKTYSDVLREKQFHVYRLNKENVNDKVPEAIGNYRLGYCEDNEFIVKYVGRDDSDIHRRLLEHVRKVNAGEESKDYKYFWFVEQTCARNAYWRECKDYHNPTYVLDNEIHPAKPDGMDWKCPNQKCEWSK